MPTRRSFLQQSAWLGAGALLSQASGWMPSIHDKRKPILILGAGLAGLSAAFELRQRGIPVLLLEAQKRLGGRVFSHTISSGESLVVELGAEWVGYSHTEIRAFADRFKLTLQNNQFNTHLIYQGKYERAGTWDFSKDWSKKWDFLLKNYGQLPEVEQEKLDQISWWRYLVDNGCSGRDLDLRELMDSTDFGESIRHVSAFSALAEYSSNPPESVNQMDFKFQGGNRVLVEKLADAVGREFIQTNTTITSVTVHDGGVTVRDQSGRSFEGAQLICTLPAFAVTRIEWKPGLPSDQWEALRNLSYARICKNAFLFRERFWKDEDFDLVTDGPSHYIYHGTKHQPSKAGVLIGYSIGDKAMSNALMQEGQRLDALRLSLQPMKKDPRLYYNKQETFYWGSQPHTQGAYAIYRPGQWTATHVIMSQSAGPIHFAGEHLDDEWTGFMEGAIRSGKKAAERITS